jgi:hypothetical protein
MVVNDGAGMPPVAEGEGLEKLKDGTGATPPVGPPEGIEGALAEN